MRRERLLPASDVFDADFVSTPVVMQKLEDALQGKHLLLTGATGFFGVWLLRLLACLRKRGVDLRVTAISRRPDAFLDTHPEYRQCEWLSFLRGDVRELQYLSVAPADLILHAAADTSAVAHANPLELFDTIVLGARQVLDFAVRSGGSRVLLIGSGAQYGALLASDGVVEEHIGACWSNHSGSAYGEAKRAQETLGAIYAKECGLEVVMTRCFAFSGPGLPLNAHFAIGNFVRDALNADEVVLNSNGQAVRSYLHGADLAIWLLTLLLRGESGVAYNVGSDEAITIAELAHRVIDRIAPGKKVRILGRADDLGRSFYVPDITRVRALGLDVWTSLDESIDSMALWAKSCK